MQLLDRIQLDDGRNFIGVVDFINQKHVYFFDFTNNNNIDYVTLVILWKGYNPNMRFSVWCSMYYPMVQLPKVLLLPQKNIIGQEFKPTIVNRGRKVKHIFKVESITND